MRRGERERPPWSAPVGQTGRIGAYLCRGDARVALYVKTLNVERPATTPDTTNTKPQISSR